MTSQVSNELMYEFLKKMNSDISQIKLSVNDLKSEVNSLCGTMVAMQQDIHNIHGVLGRHEQRLERIESRLELRELAEAQARFEPHP